MKISYNWLQEYVDIKIAPEKLANILTMAGTEVTSLELVGDDAIFEAEVTPNRSDCLSLIGIAREVAAITGKELTSPKITYEKDAKVNSLKFELIIEDKKGCPRYIGRSLANVKIEDSPLWLKKKLERVGLRPVNNIVDITNFVLFETGQPLHAFDLDKLEGKKIIVRRAKKGEEITTIDGEKRKLNADILVIADAKKPVAIAGVMGGLDTEVSIKTKNTLLESACFDSALIRRASRGLGLSSDSSYRFERGIDKDGIGKASTRAVNLINQIAKSELIHTEDCKAAGASAKRAKIAVNMDSVNDLLGINIAPTKIASILNSLEFIVRKKDAKNLLVQAPSFREDVSIQADVTEEIARIFGYENIPLTIPEIKITHIDEQPINKVIARIREILVSQGYNETISLSLLNNSLLKQISPTALSPTRIANPLSAEQEVLRPTLLAGLLNCLANNFHHNVTDLALFEIGSIFEGTKEIPSLGLAVSGLKYRDWLRRIQEKASVFDLKGALEVFLSKLGVDNFTFENQDFIFFAKGKSAVLKIAGQEAGFLGEVSTELLDQWQIKSREVFIAQINVEALIKVAKMEKAYKQLINFPSVKRDISLLADISITSRQIEGIIKENRGEYLKSVSLIEQYIGKQIPAGSQGLVYSLEYQAPDRTLKDEEVNSAHSKICEALKNKLNITIR